MANYHTRALFYETRQLDRINPTYTTKPKDYKVDGIVYLSMKRIYLEIGDPTEHEFVQAVFDGNWKHWEAVAKSYALKDVGMDVERWREELEVKIKSDAIKCLIADARSDKGSSASSAKWLAEGGWKGPKRGRPSNKEVERERKIQAGIQDDIQGDLDRMQDLLN